MVRGETKSTVAADGMSQNDLGVSILCGHGDVVSVLEVCEPVLAMPFAKALAAFQRVSIAVIFSEMSMPRRRNVHAF